MGQHPQEQSTRSDGTSSPDSLSRPHTPTPEAPRLKLPELSQFSIACYAGFIALAALYVAHTSANTSADAAILANKIGTAGLAQAQAANQIQLLQLCLLNSTLLTDACEPVLATAASLVADVAASTIVQYGTATANDEIEGRFVRELMGFHIAFFSLLLIALVHVVYSLLRPVKEYMRQSRAWRSRSGGELSKQDSRDGVVDQDGAGIPCQGAADRDRVGQIGDIEMAHTEWVIPISSANVVAPEAAWAEKHVSLPEIAEGNAG